MPEELPADGGAPEATQTPEPGVDYEQRWKDTHTNWNTLNEQMSKFQKDPNAVLDFIREHHPDMLEEDEPVDEPEYDDEPTDDPRIAQLERQLAQQGQQTQQFLAWQAEQKYEKDLGRFTKGRDLNDEGREWVQTRCAAGGNTPEALEKAVNRWFELTQPPTAPGQLQAGKAATNTKPLAEMTDKELEQWQVQRLHELNAQ